MLWDYDPEWPKDRLNMYPYQAAEFACQEACAAMLHDTMRLEGNTKQLALEFTNRAYLVDEKDNYAALTLAPTQPRPRPPPQPHPNPNPNPNPDPNPIPDPQPKPSQDNYAGVRFRIDPRFYLAHFNAGVAWTQA